MSARAPARLVPDYHPFAGLHKRLERHLIPPLRIHNTWVWVVGAIFLSVLSQRVLRKSVPRTMDPEWKAEEEIIDRQNARAPIKHHTVGAPVIIPPELLEVGVVEDE